MGKIRHSKIKQHTQICGTAMKGTWLSSVPELLLGAGKGGQNTSHQSSFSSAVCSAQGIALEKHLLMGLMLVRAQRECGVAVR